MNKKILITASLLGVLAIMLGAFGVHGLKALISNELQQSFETGVRYQMYHALLLLFVGMNNNLNKKTKRAIFYTTVVGVIFFSGSIYGLATNEYTSFNFKSIALITPIGGLLLIASWSLLLINFLKMATDK